MTKLLSIVGVLIAAIVGYFQRPSTSPPRQTSPAPSTESSAPGTRRDSAIDQAFAGRQSNLQVEGQGQVTRILADDHDGSRHQKFLIRIPSGLTVLIAHNIDLAPRIGNLSTGDSVEFRGEYEWSAKGGVIHWTHRDPAGRHPDGWIRHKARTYQ